MPGCRPRRDDRVVNDAISDTKEESMSSSPMPTETSPTAGAPSAGTLPDYAPVPRSALGPALNEQGYYVGRVERTSTGSPTAPTMARS